MALLVSGIRYRRMVAEDMQAMSSAAIINTRAGQGLRNGKRLKMRDLLGRGPADIYHPDAPDIEGRKENAKAEAEAREKRILEAHRKARAKRKKE